VTEQNVPDFDSYRAILDEVPDPIWVVDEELCFVFVNSFLLDRSELTKDDWLGKPLEELWERQLNRIENSTALLETLNAILDGEISEGHTEVGITNEDEQITRTVKSVPWMVDGHVKGVMNIARDITDRKTRERQLKILDRVLRHNVRNEMSVITGNAQIVEQLGDDEISSYAENIRETATRLLDTVSKERDIVDVIRKDLTVVKIDLVNLIERRVEALQSAHPNVDVTTTLPNQATVSVLEKTDRAIEELLENAVEHTNRVNPMVHLELDTGSQYHNLHISDNGPGIPEEEVGVLTTRQIQPLFHGSGLGLWLVNWIVEESGGRLTFTEPDTGGSTVTVQLPKAK
jgi:PAS domain S-box-containing protein